MLPDAVVFDMDGTLTDTEATWDVVRRQLATDAGLPWPDGATQAIDGILSKRAGLVESVRVFGGSAAVSDSLLARVTSYLG